MLHVSSGLGGNVGFMGGDSARQRQASSSILAMLPKKPLLSLFLLSLVSNLLMLTGPLFMLQVYDRVLASRSLPTLAVLTALVCALYAFYALIEAMRGRMAIRIGNLVEKDLGGPLLAASVYMKMTLGTPPGVDALRDNDLLRQFVSGPGPMALLDLPWLPIYLAIVFLFHPLLGWLALAGASTMALLMALNEWLSRRPAREANVAQIVRQRQADDIRNNAESVLAMGMLAEMQARWLSATAELMQLQKLAGDRTGLFSSMIKGLRFLLQSAVLGLGAYLVIGGEITGGLMIAASVVTSRALAPVEQIIGQWRAFVAARQAYGRIRKMVAALPPTQRDTHMPLPKAKLSVRALATAPMGSRTPFLSGISFEIEAGDALGVLGPSGSGKSSLVRALVGAWPTFSGEVRLDDTLLRHYDPSQQGAILGYLPQRVELFQGTVAQNIARFRSGADAAEIIEAARAASVHNLISTLPNGYDTLVGEQGEMLSAGQRQQIGLARALFGKPFLVVLDEPNSNLDVEGEAALTRAIFGVRERRGIVIVVAHRANAIAAADKLLLLKGGRQVTFGPKNDVLKQLGQAPAGDNIRNLKVSAT
jgi:PrtD family type I secretion system ABC transporter